MARMLGKSEAATATRCPYGCCRDYPHRDRTGENRRTRRRERQAWQKLAKKFLR